MGRAWTRRYLGAASTGAGLVTKTATARKQLALQRFGMAALRSVRVVAGVDVRVGSEAQLQRLLAAPRGPGADRRVIASLVHGREVVVAGAAGLDVGDLGGEVA